MPLDRFLSASLAGSSVSLNFRNWHHRICGNEGVSAATPRQPKDTSPSRQAHLDLFKAGGELAFLKGSSMVSDPLQKQQHKLPVLLPAKLQLLKARGWTSGHQGLGFWAEDHLSPIVGYTHIGPHSILCAGHAGHGVIQG